MLVNHLCAEHEKFRRYLTDVQAGVGNDFPWYPYDTLANITHLDRTIQGEVRERFSLPIGARVLDVGCADGALGFLFERLGHPVHFLDNAPTNFNSMRGLRTLHSVLESRAEISEVDIDSHFELRGTYALALALGLLYHLKNPFSFLERLARHARYCLLSTRVLQYAGVPEARVSDIPMAYLVAPEETNNDCTNFWIFTSVGLERLVARAGWRILARRSVGAVHDSNPNSAERDERHFCLLESCHV